MMQSLEGKCMYMYMYMYFTYPGSSMTVLAECILFRQNKLEAISSLRP